MTTQTVQGDIFYNGNILKVITSLTYNFAITVDFELKKSTF